LKLLLSKLM